MAQGQMEVIKNIFGLLEEVRLADGTPLVGSRHGDARVQLKDNPLIDGESGHIHHGENLQAMAVTNPMEQTRLLLYRFGKLHFAQLTELLNPAFNNGVPPSLAASEPSVNYFGKGIDIAASAEMHNQSVKMFHGSLALISVRVTITSLEVLTMLISSYLYYVKREYDRGIQTILSDELVVHFDARLSTTSQTALTTEDAVPHLISAAAACMMPLVNSFLLHSSTSSGESISLPIADVVASIGAFRASFLKPSPFLGQTRLMYEFVCCTLGIKMHGYENLTLFEDGFRDVTVGDNVSIIYETRRNGKMPGDPFQ
ncbi:hypothetical protein BS47DRAFT_1388173 [Hydnum rufescens UP504]|uniref:Uncharacterized protein n=1 Tax=Hydnum rufescens UP504 TaxID=1448309 RepID=A0A9P6E1I4_9AGAM|nr:hypothetical protein BS47DRAFT_1388173 [Hydnum rufescens UP504]